MKNNKKTVLVIGVILVAVLVLIGVVKMATTIKHGGKSDHYDLECLTAPTRNPLTDCKER